MNIMILRILITGLDSVFSYSRVQACGSGILINSLLSIRLMYVIIVYRECDLCIDYRDQKSGTGVCPNTFKFDTICTDCRSYQTCRYIH